MFYFYPGYLLLQFSEIKHAKIRHLTKIMKSLAFSMINKNCQIIDCLFVQKYSDLFISDALLYNGLK